MIRVRVTCSSLSPMLMNQMSEEQLLDIAGGVRRPKPKDRPLEEVAEEKIYRDDDGNVGVPVENLFAALRGAGTKVPYKGRSNISRADGQTVLPAILSIEETFLAFTDYKQSEKPDVRRGQSNSGTTKVAVALIRPRFEEWSLQATIEIDESEVTEDTVKDLFRIAGKTQGLCDFRPQKGGPFGRFAVSQWEVLERSDETEQPAAASNGAGSKAKAEEAVAATA